MSLLVQTLYGNPLIVSVEVVHPFKSTFKYPSPPSTKNESRVVFCPGSLTTAFPDNEKLIVPEDEPNAISYYLVISEVFPAYQG
ncbi:MAG: hypothetical protein ACI4OP_03825 [Candidatus Coprovivens sp.]